MGIHNQKRRLNYSIIWGVTISIPDQCMLYVTGLITLIFLKLLKVICEFIYMVL